MTTTILLLAYQKVKMFFRPSVNSTNITTVAGTTMLFSVKPLLSKNDSKLANVILSEMFKNYARENTYIYETILKEDIVCRTFP